MYEQSFADGFVKVSMPEKGIFHISASKTDEYRVSLLNKYGVLKDEDEARLYTVDEAKDNTEISDSAYTLEIEEKEGRLRFKGSKRQLEVCVSLNGEGFSLSIPITKTERLFGLGDETREQIMKRGRTATMWVENVVTYGPIPFLVSADGWGILVNCTYKHTYDLGNSNPDEVIINAEKGNADFYIFLGDSMKEIINLYTDISGKPIMLPRYAYGLTFVCNEEEGARDLLQNCLSFRDRKIPCDIMGLEPGWMETHYDYSVNKKWNSEKFYLPYWKPENYNGDWSFFFNLRQLGFKLSLWLCCDYDLFWHEEGRKQDKKEEIRSRAGSEIVDDHFEGNEIIMDKITNPSEPWFEHLKKFVEQGAAGFKLDGAMQVMTHPDRLWAGKYHDDEIHNLYPVIYAKQMQQGYSEHTGQRALIYTPSLYAGTQQYAATWAGDTGGGTDTIPYIMNMAFCGHSNASCDLDITYPEGIHFGFLMPWSQINAWRNWQHPWFLGKEKETMIREYSELRSSLFPYLYSMAHYAAKTGLAVARPLSLVYENTSEFDDVLNMYMLGDSLLVGAFDMHLTLPEGRWYDWFTGEIIDGGTTLDYKIPEGKGGALFAKEGSVVVTQPPKAYLDEECKEKYTIHVFPGEAAHFELIEDDGITYDYMNGAYGKTEISVSDFSEKGLNVMVKKRFVPNGENIDLPKEKGFDVILYQMQTPKKVTVDGETVDFTYDDVKKTAYFSIDEDMRSKDNICEILI